MLVMSDIRSELQEMIDQTGNFTVKVSSPSQGIEIEFDVMNVNINVERKRGYFYDNTTKKWKRFKHKDTYFIYNIIVDNFIDIKMRESN